jgi:ketosteroid isomerase-like protein
VPGSPDAAGVVGRYLQALVAHDWSVVADCLAEDVVRRGPYGDDMAGREPYVTYLAGLLPTLEGYEMRVDRTVATERVVTVELTETVTREGRRIETPECLVFDVADGRITRVAVYLRRRAADPGSGAR